MPDGETDYSEVRSGVLQRDTFAPLLFTVLLDNI